MFSKREHVQLPSLNDDENVHPVLRLCSLARRLPVLLPEKHPLLGPWRSEKREFFVGDANSRRATIMTAVTSVLILLFPDDRMRQIGRETKSRSEEITHRTVHALPGICQHFP